MSQGGPDATPPGGDGLRVVALLVGEPRAQELWTLRRLAELPCSLRVVCAAGQRNVHPRKRLARLLREHGPLGVASRLAGNRFIGRSEGRRRAVLLDRLFDGPFLREWWGSSGIIPVRVAQLSHPDTCRVVEEMRPDLIVRVSGGVLKPELFSLARIATLNIHHGQAPAVRGIWSIPWGIVEGRPDWIGATVHVIDEGIDTGAVLWRGSPQLAPGDTGTTLFFRAHLAAVEALARVVETAPDGLRPLADAEGPAESVYRSAPGLAQWARYLRLGRGRLAPVTLKGAVEC